jgi:Uma2 family endonuclease
MTVTKYKFTSQEYHLMSETGLFNHEQRLELIRGEIIKMSPIGKKHCACIARLQKKLEQILGAHIIVWTQNSIRLDNNSEPQPDLALLKLRADFYSESLPTSEDILLIIEVADSTIGYDREVKIPLYAEFGINEVWLIDVNEKTLTKYTVPSSKGYKTSQRFELTDSVLCLNVEIAVTEILGN